MLTKKRTSWNKGIPRTEETKRKISESLKRKTRGKNNPNWKGGRKQRSDGYWLILKPEHPNANNQGYVREHRLVAEEIIGRYLIKEERVHHINLNKTDNRQENLYVFKNNSKHQKVKRSLNKVMGLLINKGIIAFNKETGEYYEN